MLVFYLSVPLMVAAVLVGVVPLLVASRRQHRELRFESAMRQLGELIEHDDMRALAGHTAPRPEGWTTSGRGVRSKRAEQGPVEPRPWHAPVMLRSH